MKVIELLNPEKPCLSFEFFPPKNPEQEQQLYLAISELKKYHPDFVSVTYGAMGANRENSFFWVKEIKERFKIEPVAHLTCVAASKSEISSCLNDLEKMGVENILALRGDPPESGFTPPDDGFKFAKDLIAFIKKNKPDICIGAAGFPEGHKMAASVEKDIEYLRMKIDAGAEYVITQLFFDNKFFFDYVERCRKASIKVPIIPGLMPITGYKQIKKMTEMCGATMPKDLFDQLEKFKDDPEAIKKIGREQALKQAKGLLKQKAAGLHFFVMNRAEPMSQIMDELK